MDDSPSCLTSFLISFTGMNLCFHAFRTRGCNSPIFHFIFFGIFFNILLLIYFNNSSKFF